MSSRDYRVFAYRTGSSSGSFVHLVRGEAEATLCGIPRVALSARLLNEPVCSECIEWIRRRAPMSGQYRRVERAPLA
jgi:hypothetical protein